MGKTIEDYVNGCDLCQRVKPRTHAPYGPLKPLSTPDRKWTHISYDFITGLPECEGKDGILVVVDRFSKGAHFIPCKIEGLTAESTARLFLDNVWKLHGTPESTISDRGTQFNNHFLKRLYELLDIKPSFSSAYHPETDGQTERVNQILENYLRNFVSHRQDDWVELLSQAEFSYNNHVSSTTGQSPFYLWYGEDPHFYPGAAREEKIPAAEDLAKRIKYVSDEAKAMINIAQERYKEQADKSRGIDPDFSVGDMVWLNRKNMKTDRPAKKLDWRYLGPYKVLEKVGRAYRLEIPKTWEIHPVFHSSLLEKVGEDNYDREPIPQPPEIINNEEEWEVEKILNSKIKRGKTEYLVRWKGFTTKSDEWVPFKDIENAQDMVNAFHELNPGAPLAPIPDKPTRSGRKRNVVRR